MDEGSRSAGQGAWRDPARDESPDYGKKKSEVANMSTIVLRTPEGKKVVINPIGDEKIYDAPQNPPNTGTRYTRGTDVYRHKARSGKDYFYFNRWSMWQGEVDKYELATKEQIENFIIGKCGGDYWERPNETELERLQELGIKVLEETA